MSRCESAEERVLFELDLRRSELFQAEKRWDGREGERDLVIEGGAVRRGERG
jgi:hypothetical protein